MLKKTALFTNVGFPNYCEIVEICGMVVVILEMMMTVLVLMMMMIKFSSFAGDCGRKRVRKQKLL